MDHTPHFKWCDLEFLYSNTVQKSLVTESITKSKTGVGIHKQLTFFLPGCKFETMQVYISLIPRPCPAFHSCMGRAWERG